MKWFVFSINLFCWAIALTFLTLLIGIAMTPYWAVDSLKSATVSVGALQKENDVLRESISSLSDRVSQLESTRHFARPQEKRNLNNPFFR